MKLYTPSINFNNFKIKFILYFNFKIKIINKLLFKTCKNN